MIRKIVVIPLLFPLLLAAGVAAAQPERPPPPPLPIAEIANSLGLTAQQRPQVEAILEDRRQHMEALRDVAQREHRRIDESADAQLATVLSADQLARLHDWERSHRPPRRGPPESESTPSDLTQPSNPGAPR